jgi:hypothetical protein
MGQESKRGQVITRFNASVGDVVLFRGKRYEIDDISPVGVWLKADRKEAVREFIYFYEADKFRVVFE